VGNNEIKIWDTISGRTVQTLAGSQGAALVVTPPGETHSVRLAVQMYGCELEVHPVVPGPSGGDLGT